MIYLAAIDPVDATLILAVLVLIAGVALAIMGLKAPSGNTNSQHVFAAVGVLFGLLAAGGIGTLFAQQTANTAENTAASAANDAAEQVSKEIPAQVEKAVDDAQPDSSGNPGGNNSK